MGAGDDLLRLRERQAQDARNNIVANDGRLPLSLYVIGKSPLGKFSRQRLMETVVRLDQRVVEAVADEKRDSENLRALANENEDLVARGQRLAAECDMLDGVNKDLVACAEISKDFMQALQSSYDLLDTDLSRSRARELALAGQVRRWKRRFYAGLAIFIISLLGCISLWA